MTTIFPNLNKVVEEIRRLGWTINTNYYRIGQFQEIPYTEDKLVYYPEPIFGPLFRGQTVYKNPCLATLYRGDCDDISIFINRLKLVEFEIVAREHPVIEDELNKGLHIDFVSVSQHYGIKTEILDLTNCPIVAAFFATCYNRDKKSDLYYPVTDETKHGVLYFILPEPIFNLSSDSEIMPIGLQAHKRPGEQKAFGISLLNKKKLHSLNNIHSFRFQQNKKISEKIYEALEGGKLIFPYDPIAEKAKMINNGFCISEEAFDIAFKRYANKNYEYKSMKKTIERLKIILTKDSQYRYSKTEIDEIRKEVKISKGNNIITTGLCYKKLN